MMKRLKLTFLTVMPSPYMQELFAQLHRHPAIDLRVFYMEMEAPDTYWGGVPLPDYSKVLPGRWYPLAGARLHYNPGILHELRCRDSDVVVVAGYAGLTVQWAMAWLIATRQRWVFWGERPGMRSRNMVGNAARWLAQRPALLGPSAIAGIGKRAQQHYQKLAPRKKVVNIPYYCSLKPFLSRSSSNQHVVERDQEKTVFLYCGQLIERKGVDLLVPAFCDIAAQHPHVQLHLVGEGPLRQTLENQVPNEIQSRVRFLGFHSPDQLPKLFSQADVLILPSRHDGWGVVVNQAVGAGLAVVASDAVGAVDDLVSPGENGMVVKAGDRASLQDALSTLAIAPTMVSRFRSESRRRASQWQVEVGAEKWAQLAQQVAKPRRRKRHRQGRVSWVKRP